MQTWVCAGVTMEDDFSGNLLSFLLCFKACGLGKKIFRLNLGVTPLDAATVEGPQRFESAPPCSSIRGVQYESIESVVECFLCTLLFQHLQAEWNPVCIVCVVFCLSNCDKSVWKGLCLLVFYSLLCTGKLLYGMKMNKRCEKTCCSLKRESGKSFVDEVNSVELVQFRIFNHTEIFVS